MMKKILPALLVLFCLILTAALPSCGVKYDESEIIAAAKELIPKSEEINEIFFGEGLPLASDENFFGGDNSSEQNQGYRPVDPLCGYSSIDDIKKAALLVYSSGYAEESLFKAAFEGVTITVGNGAEAEQYVVSLPRYVDSSYYSYLAGRELDDSDRLITLGRKYDTENIAVVSQKGGKAVISVPSVSPDGEQQTMELTLVMTADGWRLDTPTY